MTLHFSLHYVAANGESLVLRTLQDSRTGEHRMTTSDGQHWTCRLQAPRGTSTLSYSYAVVRGEQEVRHESPLLPHTLHLAAKAGRQYFCRDLWADAPQEAHLLSSAFTACIAPREATAPPAPTYGRTVRLRVWAPQLWAGQQLALSGAAEALGGWEPERAVPLVHTGRGAWVVDLDAADFPKGSLEFKFIIDGEMWEEGANRTLQLPPMADGAVAAYELPTPRFALPRHRLAGTLVPVFALRTAGSFGVGDFGDLLRMVQFAARTGQRVVQVLPVNDTTSSHSWTDSYPYGCISVFALHPQYIDLRQLPPLADAAAAERLEARRRELNALPAVDYEGVNAAKTDYLWRLFRQEGAQVLATEAYKAFFAANRAWLLPYASFSVLRDRYGTADFTTWPASLRRYTPQVAAATRRLRPTRGEGLQAAVGDEQMDFYGYVQFALDRQLRRVQAEARAQGVILKGDIPIGVNRHGCDVWAEPAYFHTDGQAGAPPDAFSRTGQNWGFPTYDWQAMQADGYGWWTRRLSHMAGYFDAFRMDHVLGFFRIWEIPAHGVTARLGQFSPALGLTREEICSYGLTFRAELHAEPYIATWVLRERFGEQADSVAQTYLDSLGEDRWKLRPTCDTERKIAALDAPAALKDGLQELATDVLFVRDHRQADKYHPRIAAQETYAYRALWDSEKAAFDRLYANYFYRRNEALWAEGAREKLPHLVEATQMLPCAEDLGMVPACVRPVLQQLHILTLEIQSMPKQTGERFAHLSKNPYYSVDTPTTHDMPTLREWWDEDTSRTQDFYNAMLYRTGAAPHPLPGRLARDILYRHLTSPSMLCIIALQDWLAMDETLRRKDAAAERVNVPADAHHYWRYRMHLDLDEMLQNADLIKEISDLVRQSSRYERRR